MLTQREGQKDFVKLLDFGLAKVRSLVREGGLGQFSPRGKAPDRLPP